MRFVLNDSYASRTVAPAFERLSCDLDQIVETSESDFCRLAATRLYVTGGTGFVGKWLLRAFARANARLYTDIRLDVLTRDPESFRDANPDLASDPNIRLLRGDIAPAVDGAYDGVIHAAATSSSTISPGETLRTIVDGTRALIRDVVCRSGDIAVLFISSGAAYGRAPSDGTLAEEYCGALPHLEIDTAYAQGKRIAELSLTVAARENSAKIKIARLFVFHGPGSPLEAHFAAGNLIRNAIAGRPIEVNSRGASVRSYLYPTDMVAWNLAVLTRGASNHAYNVGSDEAVTILDLAQRIATSVEPHVRVRFAGAANTSPDSRYVPNVGSIMRELGVRRGVDLKEAIEQTICFRRDAGRVI